MEFYGFTLVTRGHPACNGANRGIKTIRGTERTKKCNLHFGMLNRDRQADSITRRMESRQKVNYCNITKKGRCLNGCWFNEKRRDSFFFFSSSST